MSDPNVATECAEKAWLFAFARRRVICRSTNVKKQVTGRGPMGRAGDTSSPLLLLDTIEVVHPILCPVLDEWLLRFGRARVRFALLFLNSRVPVRQSVSLRCAWGSSARIFVVLTPRES